jgi:hypothetical protein
VQDSRQDDGEQHRHGQRKLAHHDPVPDAEPLKVLIRGKESRDVSHPQGLSALHARAGTPPAPRGGTCLHPTAPTFKGMVGVESACTAHPILETLPAIRGPENGILARPFCTGDGVRSRWDARQSVHRSGALSSAASAPVCVRLRRNLLPLRPSTHRLIV